MLRNSIPPKALIRNYVKCLPAVEPDYILTANTLPIKDGCNIRKVTPEQFSAEEGYTFTAGITADRTLRDLMWQSKNTKTKFMPQISDILMNPQQDRFVVAPMAEGLGKGLFLAPDAAPIPAGEIVMVYEGLLEFDGLQVSDREKNYLYNIEENYIKGTPFDKYRMQLGLQQYSCAMYPGEKGGLARYMQCALDPVQLAEVDGLTNEEKQHIPTTNLTPMLCIHQGCPVLAFVSTRVIQPREQLTFRYDSPNVGAGSQKLFDRYGRVIGELSANNKVEIYDAKQLKTLPKVNNHTAKTFIAWGRAGRPLNEGYPLDFARHFIMNCMFTVESYFLRGDSPTAVRTFIGTLVKEFNGVNFNTGDADKLFLSLNKILNDKEKYAAFKDNIAPMKKEIIMHMTEYNGFKMHTRNAQAKQVNANAPPKPS